MKKLKYPAIFVLLLSLPGLFAFRTGTTSNNYFEISKNLEIFTSVVKEVDNFYVDEIDASKLVRVGIDAMLESLDPYTTYYSESEIEDYRFMTTGQYGGIGATISQRDDFVMIAEPYENSPAAKAGLRGGDLIISIDGKDVKGKNSDEISKLLKGTPGTELTLVVKRPGVDGTTTKTFKREEIQIKNVPYYGMINDQIGYIKFTNFRQNASGEVRDAILELKKNPGLKGLVLDLRGNPGGLLDEAIKTVNLFVPKGKIVVKTKGKMEDWNKEYFTNDQPVETELPVVVLTDRGSASASEIVSGSLQDYDRAILIGDNTFGKGLVQTTRSLPYNAQMKITTSKYYIPSGRCIQALDYSHKDDNGKATKIADSLRHPFKTTAGRTVYDGNGIHPDVVLERKKYSDVVMSLGGERLFYDYATLYRNTHESIGDPKKFSLTEKDWQDFLAFLKDKSYEYKTDTEENLKKLKEMAEEEKYMDAIKEEIAQMEKDLAQSKRDDVLKNKADIMEILEEEIASRYGFQSARVEAQFDDDQDVLRAIQVLNDPSAYRQILTVK